MYWICVSINPYFLQNMGEDKLGDLFFEIFSDDYIDHYLIDYDEFEKNYDIDRYVFVYCREYELYIDKLREHRNIKNVLNSFNDVVTIPESEVLETKTSVQTIIYDDDYCVNRTGFFMFGDIVRVLHGSFSLMNGIVLSRSEENPEFYTVYFRLFVRRFCKLIHFSNINFNTSVFKFIKIPVGKGLLTKSKGRINKIIKSYEKLMDDNERKRLVDSSIVYEEVDSEIDIASLVSNQSQKKETNK